MVVCFAYANTHSIPLEKLMRPNLLCFDIFQMSYLQPEIKIPDEGHTDTDFWDPLLRAHFYYIKVSKEIQGRNGSQLSNIIPRYTVVNINDQFEGSD